MRVDVPVGVDRPYTYVLACKSISGAWFFNVENIFIFKNFLYANSEFVDVNVPYDQPYNTYKDVDVFVPVPVEKQVLRPVEVPVPVKYCLLTQNGLHVSHPNFNNMICF